MTKSAEDKSLGVVVTMTEGGNTVHICSTTEKPKKRLFPALAHSIQRHTRYAHKNLVWSPHTEPKPDKYRWDPKGGGYQGLPIR